MSVRHMVRSRLLRIYIALGEPYGNSLRGLDRWRDEHAGYITSDGRLIGPMPAIITEHPMSAETPNRLRIWWDTRATLHDQLVLLGRLDLPAEYARTPWAFLPPAVQQALQTHYTWHDDSAATEDIFTHE